MILLFGLQQMFNQTLIFFQKKTNDELEKAFQAHHENLELMIGPEQALHGILPSQNFLNCKFTCTDSALGLGY